MKIIFMIYVFMSIENNSNRYFKVEAQFRDSELTMEKFLDRLLQESVYDRRIRPYYRGDKGNL